MRRIETLMAAGVLLLATSGLAAAETAQPSCDQVAAAMEEGGGGTSTDQVAAQLKTTAAHVRECMDKIDAAKKAKPAAGAMGGGAH